MNTDLKFDGSTDPVEYLSRFNTEMDVYQVEDLARCRLLASTLGGNAHQWFKKLAEGSIKPWRKMGDQFISQFRATVAYAPPRLIPWLISSRESMQL